MNKLLTGILICFMAFFVLIPGKEAKGATVIDMEHVAANIRMSGENNLVKALQTKNFQLTYREWEGLEKTFSSSNSAVASIDQSGMVTLNQCGTTTLEVSIKVTADTGNEKQDGTNWMFPAGTPTPTPTPVPTASPLYTEYKFYFTLCVVDPRLEIREMNLAKGCDVMLGVQGMDAAADTEMQWSSSDSKLLSIYDSDGKDATVYARKKGTAKVSVQVAGVLLSATIHITDPQMKNSYAFLTKGGKASICVTGLNSKSKVVFHSNNAKYASVSSKGKVKARKIGGTFITCSVDQKTMYYSVSVGKKKAIRAIRSGMKLIGHSKYSQTKRMQRGYYDCSSFVYRMYKKSGITLLSNGWAPTAADIGQYLDQKKKTLKTKKGYWKQSAMQPGDLICYRGAPNGRYKNINHVALYCGNGLVLEASNSMNGIVMRSFWDSKPSKKYYVIGRIV